MFKKYLFLVLSLLIAAAAAADEVKFKVGVIVPLSGGLREYGEAMRGGIELAKSEYPNKFKNIEFLYEDVGHDAAKAALAFRKLKDVDGIDVAYPFGVHLSRAVAPIAESMKFPVVAQSVDKSIAVDSKYVVRFFNHSGQYADALLAYTRKNNLKKIGIVMSEASYFEDILIKLKERKLSDETIKVVDEYAEGQSDFRSTVTKISRADYDVIGVLLGSGQVGVFYRQMKAHNLNIPTFGTNYFESSSEFEASNGGMAGAVFANNFIQPAFEDRYRKKWDNTAQITFAACSYEFALMLAENFSQLGRKLGSEEIMGILRQEYKREKAATGGVEFVERPGEGGFFESPIYVKKILTDGRLELLG